MPISFSCPECGKGVNAPDHFAGKRARCPQCKAILIVPTPEPAEDREYEVVDEDGNTSGAAQPPPAPSVRQRDEWGGFVVTTDDQPPPSAPSVWQPMRGSSAPASEAWSRRVGAGTGSSLGGTRSTLEVSHSSGRDRLYWLLALALVPLAFSLVLEDEDTAERIERTREANPSAFKQYEENKAATEDDLFRALPGGRIEGAHLPRKTWMHWLYAAVAAAGFFSLVVMFFRKDSAPRVSLLLVGLFTGTIGILLLLGVQWAGIASQGVWLRGRGIAILLFYIVKFIGFSYMAALDPDNGFFLSFLGFTCGVGFCEELCKALPIIMEYRRRSTMDWRGACLWGLASGVGFGVSEGITYSSDYYNGVATWGIYVVRFVSCVALHAMWSGSVGILIYRNQSLIEGDMGWTDWFVPLGKFLGVAMVLHGLYDTMLKRDMNLPALVVAIVSFGGLVWIVERTRAEEKAEPDAALARA